MVKLTLFDFDGTIADVYRRDICPRLKPKISSLVKSIKTNEKRSNKKRIF